VRKRDVIGRTIVDVHQETFYDEMIGATACAVYWLELDNGARIVLHNAPTEDVPYNYASVVPAARATQEDK
jgi:hypothetical protein